MAERRPGPESGYTDPSGIQEPHDVLAAEEFGIGTPDQRYPADPTGIEEPHDVLAAEEFAMPAPGSASPVGAEPSSRKTWLPAAILVVVGTALLLRRRR